MKEIKRAIAQCQGNAGRLMFGKHLTIGLKGFDDLMRVRTTPARSILQRLRRFAFLFGLFASHGEAACRRHYGAQLKLRRTSG
ncbi:MAG: hypothetical protein ACO1NO_06705 [Burkholderiaceae bacterium]